MAVIEKNNIKVVSSSNCRGYISKQDAKMDARAVEAVKAALYRAKLCEKPIAKYDVKSKKAYLEYPDGRIVDVR